MIFRGLRRTIPAAAALLALYGACAQDKPRPEPAPRPAAVRPAAGLAGPAAALPEGLRAGILADQKEFSRRARAVLAEAGPAGPDGLLVLVDKKRGLPAAYEPVDLTGLNGLGIKTGRRGLALRRPAAEALAEMARAAAAAGITLTASSAYRSFAYQREVWERNVREMGEAKAGRESARPGHSQHQLGTAVDFGSIDDSFASTPAARWLTANAWRFGFSLSYPDGLETLTGYRHESWHYRFIGRAAAGLERDFFGGIQQYMLEFLPAFADPTVQR